MIIITIIIINYDENIKKIRTILKTKRLKDEISKI